MHNVIKLTALIEPVFKCASCGATAAGDAHTVTAHSQDGLSHILRQPAPVHYLPVGWASYGDGRVKCPTCIT